MAETLVKVENLSKKFCRNLKRSLWYGIKDIGAELRGSRRLKSDLRRDEFWALKDVNFEIKQGELIGLIGPNGAGKTTLLKVLSGLIKPDHGRIEIRGKIQALIALGAGFNPILTGRENIYVNGAILGFTKKQLDGMIDEIVDFAEIGEFIDMPVQSYSSGMHVRLGFSVAVNLKPNILIVDEVLAVGDASFKRKARNKMMELLHSGISVLFVSHNMALVSSITSRCIYLKKGNIISFDSSDKVTAMYLSDAVKRTASEGSPVQSGTMLMESAYFAQPGLFRLLDVTLTDTGGNKTAEFHTFDTICVRFGMEFLTEVENVTLALNIQAQEEGAVLSASKMKLEGPCNGKVTVTCRIDRNVLREGNYSIGFFASDFSGGSLFKSNHVAGLSVLAQSQVLTSGDAHHGFFVMEAGWETVGEEKKSIDN